MGAAALAALIVLAFLLALRHYRTDVEDDVDAEHESILSLDLIKAQLAQLLGRRRVTAHTPAHVVRSRLAAMTLARRSGAPTRPCWRGPPPTALSAPLP